MEPSFSCEVAESGNRGPLHQTSYKVKMEAKVGGKVCVASQFVLARM